MINNFINLIHTPALLILLLIISGIIFANGALDSPNSIATCISTRSLSSKRALILFVVCGFSGIVIMSMLNSTIAQTIYSIANFRRK